MSKPEVKCPECGGSVTIHTDGAVSVPYAGLDRKGPTFIWKWAHRPFAACNACEWCWDSVEWARGRFRPAA